MKLNILILTFLNFLNSYCIALHLKDPISDFNSGLVGCDLKSKNIKDGMHVVVSNILDKSSIKNNQTIDSVIHKPDLHFFFISILSEDEIFMVKDSLIYNQDNYYFICSKEITDFILKEKITSLNFLRENCVENDVSNIVFTNGKFRRLVESNQIQIPESNLTQSTPKPDDEDTKEKSCFLCSSLKNIWKRSRKDILGAINSSFPDDIKKPDSDGFQLPQLSDDERNSNVNFEIELKDKSDIFDDILKALEQENDSGIYYTGFTNNTLSSQDLINKLQITEEKISDVKKQIEFSDEKETDEQNIKNEVVVVRRLFEKNNLNFKIKKDIFNMSIINATTIFTNRFIETDNQKLKTYFTPTRVKSLFFALHEYLVLYSTIENYLQEIVDIINTENGILDLYNFFNQHIHLNTSKYILEQYFGKYDELKKKIVYSHHDFVRFFVNLNMNKLNPKTPSNLFILKLDVTSRIMLFPEVINKPINFDDYVFKSKENLFYNDFLLFNYMFKETFLNDNHQVIEKINEIILRIRNLNPIDRPKECYIQIRQILFDLNSQISNLEEEKLETICFRTYGLLGIVSNV